MTSLVGYKKYNNKMVPVFGGGGGGHEIVEELPSVNEAKDNFIYFMEDEDAETKSVKIDIPVGTVISYAGNTVPMGYFLCDGTTKSKSAYPELFNAIGYTYGGSGDSFKLPDLRDKFIEGSEEAGVEKEVGLPNITGADNGSIWAINSGDSIPNTGALQVAKGAYQTKLGANGTSYSVHNLSFNASLSNPIYGKSSTVQPPAITMLYIIKAYNGIQYDDMDLSVANVVDNVNELNNNAFNLNNDFAILQVNGGNNIDYRSTYVVSNPYPNYYVHCVAEVKYDGVWCPATWYCWYESGYYRSSGVTAYRNDDDNIFVATGSDGLCNGSRYSGGTIPYNVGVGVGESLPCRVKVWKVGKIQ